MKSPSFLNRQKSNSKSSTSALNNRQNISFQPSLNNLYERVIFLQRTIGNKAVNSLLKETIQKEPETPSTSIIPPALLEVGHRPLSLPTFTSPSERLAERFRLASYRSLVLDSFAINSANLTENHEIAMAENGPHFRQLTEQYPDDGIVQITGYCDLTGPARDPEGFNYRLGRQRAEAVASALSSYVMPAAMRVDSGGWHNPVVPEEGYNPANRRVEIVFRRLNTGLGLLEPLAVGEVSLPSEIELPSLVQIEQEIRRIVTEEIEPIDMDHILQELPSLGTDVSINERFRQLVQYFVSRLVRDTIGPLLRGRIGDLIGRSGYTRNELIDRVSETVSDVVVEQTISSLSEAATDILGHSLSEEQRTQMQRALQAFIDAASRTTFSDRHENEAESPSQQDLVEELTRIMED